MSADVIPFPTKADTERNALITQARANYESIFPAETTTSVLGALGAGQSATLAVADLPNVGPQERNRERIDAIRHRDNFKFCASDGVRDICDDLRMDHADNGMPSDVAYHAPEWDPA